jgi:CMP-N,N'-diacetyllegionaminic acid synthase
MINNLSILAIVPARGGSKGLPRKNVKNFCGKPLINWTIEAGQKSKYIDNLIVSSDDLEISDTAISAGAEVPFVRPLDLSTDQTKTIDVLLHAYNTYTQLVNKNFDLVVLLEPTSPLRRVDDIDNAIEQLVQKTSMTSIVGIARVESQHPSFLLELSEEGAFKPYLEHSPEGIRRQDLSPLYYPEGTIYVSWAKTLFEEKTFYQKKTMGFLMPSWRAIEIDDEYDFIKAEALMTRLILNNG